MKDLKCISYDNLKKLMDAVQNYEQELDALDSEHSIALWENEKLCSPSNAIIDYLDNILWDDNASYFAYETNFGNATAVDGNPYCINKGDVSYSIKDFDSWYEFLLADEGCTND